MNYTSNYLFDIHNVLDDVISSESISGKSFLITGATGLIGSCLVDSLLVSDKIGLVYAAGRDIKKIKERFAFWGNKVIALEYHAEKDISFDINVDYIIHCASNANPMAYSTQPIETIMINILGTNNLLKYATSYCKERFLYVSSSEVYGIKNEKTPYEEKDYSLVDILNPRSCYPSSKRTCETLCASYVKEYGLDVVIVRPGHVYGPSITSSDTRAHAQFARDVKNKRNIVMKSKGMQLRSYCYVLDCVSALLTVLAKGQRGQAYNISNKEAIVTIREFAEMHAQIAGQQVEFMIPDEVEKDGFNLMTNSSLDSKKIEALGWCGKYNIERGVRATIDAL